MRIHVTGGTGYLGSELLRRARGATSERVEIRDAAAVRSLFERLRPAVVIHTAYRQDGPGAWEITVDGAENVAAAAYAVGMRVMHERFGKGIVRRVEGRGGGCFSPSRACVAVSV